MTLKVKICGITRLKDALAACEYGAEVLGFNFWPQSRRYCPVKEAAKIVDRLPPFVTPIALFVNASGSEIRRTLRDTGIAYAQLHGDETPAFCRSLTAPLLKAIQVRNEQSLGLLRKYRSAVAGFVLDAPSTGYGGSGTAFDWKLAKRAAKAERVLLAGGLNPKNVAEAVRVVQPFGVDVASGVESAPGVKDLRAMKLFIERAHRALDNR